MLNCYALKKLIAEKRKSARLTIGIPVSYEILGDKKNFGSSLVKDIDISGLRIRSDKFFPANIRLILTLHFPEVKRTARTEARIVWSQRINFSNNYFIGLEFMNLNPLYKRWLEEYIQIHNTLKNKGGIKRG